MSARVALTCTTRTYPMKLTSICCLSIASGKYSAGPLNPIPAQLITPTRPPLGAFASSLATRAAAAATLSSLVTSRGTMITLDAAASPPSLRAFAFSSLSEFGAKQPA